MFELNGKYALVTGASRGIGKGIALSLAEQGANIAINYRSSIDKAHQVQKEIEAMGQEAIVIQADVSKSEEVAEMFEKIKEEWGRLDILVNNAGIVQFKDFEDISEEDWDKVLDVNLKGQFLCSQEAVKIMKKNSWGRIINIASIASGDVGVGFMQTSHYTASKGGVKGLTENMALELGKYGINVNAIGPGVIETDMTQGMVDDEQTKKGMLQRIPKGRVGNAEDIGAATAFLASEEADYITGAVLYVDGGWLAG